MKTLMSVATLLLAGSISSICAAENVPVDAGIHSSQIHKVRHAIADQDTYNKATSSGYKWANHASDNSDNRMEVAKVANERKSGYKWINATESNSDSVDGYASTAEYQFGENSYADETGYRWGHRNFADQAGYRWGHRNFADQAGYRWGHRNFADQAGYRWGHR